MYNKTSTLLAAALAAPLFTSSAFAVDVAIVNGDMNTWSNGALVDAQDAYPVNGTGQDGWRTWADRNNGSALRLWDPSATDRSSTANNQFFDTSWGGLDGEGLAGGYVLTVRTQAWDYRNAGSVNATTNLAQRWTDDYGNRIWNIQDGADPAGSVASDPRFEWRFDDGGSPDGGTGVVGDPYTYTNELTVDAGTGNYISWNDTASRDFEAATQILTEAFDPTAKYTLSVRVGRLAEGDGTASHDGSGLNAGERIDPNDGVTVLGTSSRFFNDAPALWGGYNVELMTGGENIDGSSFAGGVYGDVNLVAGDFNSLTLAEDTWGNSVVGYTPGTGPDLSALAGENLTIRLSALETPGAHQNTNVAAFDNVVLTKINAGDADEDDDVDNGDVGAVVGGFTGSGGSGRVWATGDFDGDGDTDNADVGTVVGNFTGSAAGNLTDSGNIADLRYDPATGNITLDASEAAGGVITSFQLENGGAGTFNPANYNSLAGTGGFGGFFQDVTANTIGDSDLTFVGASGLIDLGDVAPTGLDLAALEAYLSSALYAGQAGSGQLEFDLVVVPEPSSLALLGLGGLFLARRRRSA